LNAGGIQIDWGTATNTTISSGGVQHVASGGTANSTTIDSGGTEHVFAGGAAHDVTFGAPSAGSIATLVLDQTSSAFTGAISGWQAGDRIDLGDILFNQPGTTLGYSENAANTGGTLTVSDGSHVASLALLGQYMASSFALSSDGNGGTFVTDPAIAAQATIATPHHA
jgi:autotransporter passenger strand-loop-strand repeat protein